MTNVELLTIVEVTKSKKVVCQHDTCGRSVYKRIHVIRVDRKIKVFGSECYKKLYGKIHASKKITPIYGSDTGILLSEDERKLLLENTEELLSQLVTKYAQAKKEIKNQKEAEGYSNASDAELREFALEKTKEDFRKNKNLNPNLPGWIGWVKSDAEKLYKKLKGE